MSAPLQFERASQRFGEKVAVDELSFEVRAGETFGLIGPDGAGKTTTLRMGLGLLAPSTGTVRTFELDPFRHRRRLSQHVGYLSQRFSIYGDLSVDENVAFFAKAHEMRDWKPRREELLERLDLARFRKRLADRLSGGMKQKLALACTLVHTPRLLVLDEPTTGVDPVSRREFWSILSELQKEGMTLVVTTPYLDEAERCHRVGLIEHGRLLVVDEPSRIRASLGGTMLEILAHPRRQAQELLRARPEVGDIEAFGERIHVSLPAASAAQAPALASALSDSLKAAGVEVRAIRSIEPSLEDVFIAKLRASGAALAQGRAVLGALLLCCALAFSNATLASPSAAGVDTLSLSLQQALEQGVQASSRLEQLRQVHGADLGTLTEVRSARFPRLSANAGYTRLSEEAEFTLQSPAGEVSINPNLPDRWRLRVGVQWPIFTFGQTSNLVRAAERTLQASSRDVDAGHNELELEIAQAYWQLVTQRETELVVSEALRSYDAHLQDAQHRLDAGMATRNELLTIQVERDRAELALLEARQQLLFAHENLQRLLGVTSPLRPTQSLELVTNSTLGADSLSTLQREALSQRPERAALRARIEAAQAKVGAEKAGYFPQLSLIGGWDQARPNSRLLPPEDRWEDSWDAGVQVSWSLFDGGRIAGAAARALGTARALSAQLQDFDARVQLAVATRARDLETVRQAAQLSQRSVESAQENLLVSRNLYREGVLASSDLLDAETNLLRARLDRTQTLARERVAEAALLHVVGRSSVNTDAVRP